ncbi:MAG: hypothetical protein E7649_07480 [Ruminococcaceae bacterium]|nr:hypothetical protein [Oscillospiraceae bacterium]
MSHKKDRKYTPSPKKELSPKTRQLAISLVINTIILIFVYYGSMAINVPIISVIVTWGYLIILGGFLVAYIAYNRAFTRKELTVEMLPADWSYEKKQQYINDGKERMEKSRWMLSVIIPFLIVIMVDVLYLFVWTGWLENLFK